MNTIDKLTKKKFTKVTNKAIYLIICLLFSVFSFTKNKKNAPTEGNKISEDKIGKSITLKLRMSKLQRSLKA